MRVLLVLLLLSGAALGSPFLVCDPYPANSGPDLTPVAFGIKGLLAHPLFSSALVNSDGSVQLRYDMGSIGFGTYSAVVFAVNAAGAMSVDSATVTWITDSTGTHQVSAPPPNTGTTPVTPANVKVSPQ